MKTDTAPKLLAALNVEKANIGTYKSDLGFGDPEIDECTQDQANLEVALENVPIATESKQSVTEVKDQVYNGDPDESINAYPSFALTALPNPAVKAGALSRYNNRKGRAKLASGYTEQIGIAMGYVDTPAEPVSPGSVKPVIDVASPAASGYSFTLVISGREDADAGDVLIRRGGSETWAFAKSFTGKAVDITISPTTPGQPEKIQVTVQLKRKNENYGQPSDAVSVTVNP
jgi:hypothetical protein